MSVVDLVNPNEFFYSKVGNASERLNISLSPELEHYLVTLLCDFIQPSSLNLDELDIFDAPLAMIYKKALETTPHMQLKVYKRLGDVSLYIAGYFKDSLNRKIVNEKYYISMGSSAYRTASQITRIRHNEAHFTRVYYNLALEFSKLVSIMSLVSNDLPQSLDESKILQLMDASEDAEDCTQGKIPH